MTSYRRSSVTPEPRSVEEALEHLADGIAVDACDQCSSDLAFLRSELDRLRGIEEAARSYASPRARKYGPAYKLLRRALARPDRQEEGE